MSEQVTALAVDGSSSPEKYIRINITKTSKGYSYETTASVRWIPVTEIGEIVIQDLLESADRAARVEIAKRVYADEHPEDPRNREIPF